MKISEKQLMTCIGILLTFLIGNVIYIVKDNKEEIKLMRTDVKENFREISGLSARISKLEP